MTDAVLVLNAGSSSLKFTLFDLGPDETPAPLLEGAVEAVDAAAARFRARDVAGASLADEGFASPPGHAGALDRLLDFLDERTAGARLRVVGHRVVHGGEAFCAPTLLDAASLKALEALVPLAPLHQPHNLTPIRAMAARRPDVPQVACFDTAFHAGAPAVERAYAVPPEIAALGVRRYGFHGLSYEHVAAVLPALDPAAAAGRAVALHLGAGASMCALRAGRSVATTMGFSALEGLPMATRSGALDPGALLHLMQAHGFDAAALEDLLYRRSGLLGVSGLSGDMRDLLASGAPRARFAVELFVHRIARELGSLAAALGGLDAVVFTGGVGENAAPVRAMTAERSAWLGLVLDPVANAAPSEGARRIDAPASRVRAWVVPADEEAVIARQALALVDPRPPAPFLQSRG